MNWKISIAVTPLAALAFAAACGNDDGGRTGGDDPEICIGAKCDTPQANSNEERQAQCLNRQDEVLASSKRAFTEDWVRWSCGDVEGVNTVNQDDRGQEYCEYFAIVDLPGQDPIDLGRRRSNEGPDVTPWGICVDGEEAFSPEASENCATRVSEDLLFDLEDNPTEVVGQCVFTSWMSDVAGPLPVCEGGGCTEDVLGFPLTEQYFRMKLDTNSNATASSLVQTCAEIRAKQNPVLAVRPDFDDPDDLFHEPFYRGCWMAGSFGLSWRRSDPAICAVANRVVECGCTIPGVATEEIGAAVVPTQEAGQPVIMRGFHLGSWDDAFRLPPSCRYVNMGDDSKTIVSCDLTAGDVLGNLSDPKEACRSIYGNNIVAHAPVPADQLECTTPDDPLANGCGEMPWNIGRENGGPATGDIEE